ncbi:Coiled-coil domain-containing protein 58-like protein, partial [Dinothrombium tinctorium]
LNQSYKAREVIIKKCIEIASKDVKQLKEKRDQNPSDLETIKKLKKEQTKLRLMQNELNVEEIVRDRTIK